MSPTRSSRLALAFTLTATAAMAQVTDEAVISNYGASCSDMTLTVDEQILGSGHRALTFDVAGAVPNQPVAVFFGPQQVDLPLPFSACSALTNMKFAVQAVLAAGDGSATWQIQAPGPTEFAIHAQAISLDLGAGSITASDATRIVFPGQSPTEDPGTRIEYPCANVHDVAWSAGDAVGTVTARIRFPLATCNPADGPPANSPVVVFMHGWNQGHTDHDYLMTHLAKNGFVACSIANGGYLGGTNEGRAQQAMSFLWSLHEFWSFRDNLSFDTVLMGQGRGGEAALTAARLMHNAPTIGVDRPVVRAIVAIAPTDGGQLGTEPKESMTGSHAQGFLAIYGSRDNVVTGSRLEDGLVAAERTAFAIYDRVGTEDSPGPLVLHPPIAKSLVHVRGAGHRCFEDTCSLSDPATLTNVEHRNVTRAYCNAFLRWRIFGEAAHRDYFTGDDTPTTVALDGTESSLQFSETWRRVIDNFEQAPWSQSTVGDDVVKSAGILTSVEAATWSLDPSSPHDTKGMLVSWDNEAGLPWIRWEIPDTPVSITSTMRDVSGYGYVSLRVAQHYGHWLNEPGVDMDFKIRLASAAGSSNFLNVSDFGRIPYPETFFAYPLPHPLGDYTKSGMTTIRIPLAAFDNLDPSSVHAIYLRFDAPGHEDGAAIIDSIEFVN